MTINPLRWCKLIAHSNKGYVFRPDYNAWWRKQKRQGRHMILGQHLLWREKIINRSVRECKPCPSQTGHSPLRNIYSLQEESRDSILVPGEVGLLKGNENWAEVCSQAKRMHHVCNMSLLSDLWYMYSTCGQQSSLMYDVHAIICKCSS